MEGLLDLNIRVTGADHLTDRPTLFVVNHFTRFETMIIPYVTSRYIPKQVRNLADHALFKGVLGRYLRSCRGSCINPVAGGVECIAIHQ